MVYQALRAYQDHQVSEAGTLPVHRHNIVLASSLVSESFNATFLTVSSKASECSLVHVGSGKQLHALCATPQVD